MGPKMNPGYTIWQEAAWLYYSTGSRKSCK